jgi:hypothetical protein
MLTTLLHEQPKEAPSWGLYASEARHWCSLQALGFLLQRDHPTKALLIEHAGRRLSAGYAKLDPALPADRLVTAWRVWVPASELREAKP